MRLKYLENRLWELRWFRAHNERIEAIDVLWGGEGLVDRQRSHLNQWISIQVNVLTTHSKLRQISKELDNSIRLVKYALIDYKVFWDFIMQL